MTTTVKALMTVLHRETRQHAVVQRLLNNGTHYLVKIKGTGRREHWSVGVCLELPQRKLASHREIELAIANGLTINQLRRANG